MILVLFNKEFLMSQDDNQKKQGSESDSVECCGCKCNWSKGELASFLRHLASFFDKKK